MKQQICVLYANAWDLVDEKTGEKKEGTTINYIMNTDMGCMDNSDGSKGLRSAKSSSPYETMLRIPMAPAMYDAEFSMKIGGDGKPVLTICDLTFIAPVELVIQSAVQKAADDSSKK